MENLECQCFLALYTYFHLLMMMMCNCNVKLIALLNMLILLCFRKPGRGRSFSPRVSYYKDCISKKSIKSVFIYTKLSGFVIFPFCGLEELEWQILVLLFCPLLRILAQTMIVSSTETSLQPFIKSEFWFVISSLQC